MLFQKQKPRHVDKNIQKSQGILNHHLKYITSLLEEIPTAKRLASFIPLLSNEEWAKGTLLEWVKDPETPKNTQKAINHKFGGQ